MTNRQFAEVELLAKKNDIDLQRCPTCKSRQDELAPGFYEWPEAPTYKYMGDEHVCDCQWQDTLRRHYLLARVPPRYWRLGPNEYFGDPDAMAAAQEYLESWDFNKEYGHGIEFFSPVQGVGKTFLATYIARQLVRRSEPVHFVRFREIMGLYDKPYEIRQEEEERLWYTRVLVLDEVCKPLSEGQGNYFAHEFENLIRSRTDYDRVTIMTTNLTPGELDHYYPRTYSLLAAKQERYEIKGEDVRRSDDVRMLDRELAANGEARPLC